MSGYFLRVDTIGHWVQGRAVAGSSDRTGPVYDPARGEQIGEVSLASSGEVEDVIKSAADASVAWAESSLTARANLLFRLRDLIDRHRDDLGATGDERARQGRLRCPW